MKPYQIISSLFLLTVLATGCKKDDPASSPAPATSPLTGSWQVASFTEDSTDLTSRFSGYTFSCNGNNGLTIAGNGNIYSNCMWHWSDDSHTECNIHIMGCDSSSVLWKLADDWDFSNHGQIHCYFTGHHSNHYHSMTWVRI